MAGLWMRASHAMLDVQHGLAITLQMVEILLASEEGAHTLSRQGLQGFLQDATRLLEENRGDSLAAFQEIRHMVLRRRCR